MSPGDYTISGDGRTIRAFRTDDPVRVSNGYGGWQTTDRPKRPALTTWQGRQPFTIEIPMLLDGWPDVSIEPDIRDLNLLATGVTGQGTPDITLDGVRGIPQRASGTWVIQDLTWGDYLVRGPRRTKQGVWIPADGSKVRQEVTIALLERVTDRQLAASTTRARSGRTRHYKVKKGDTLLKIAARELGDATRWVDIAVLNGLRSSGQLKTNQTLRLP